MQPGGVLKQSVRVDFGGPEFWPNDAVLVPNLRCTRSSFFKGTAQVFSEYFYDHGTPYTKAFGVMKNMTIATPPEVRAWMNARDARQKEEFKAVVASCVLKPGGHFQEDGPTNRLYTITTIAATESQGGTRCVVVCDSFDRAREIVETNEGDIFETTYRLAVIEVVLPNHLYHYTSERYWYRWEGPYPEGRYLAVSCPEAYENAIGFGIG